MRLRIAVPSTVRALLLAGAVAVAAPLPVAAQTMIQAMVEAYNSNPDLLSQRARLRVVDETVSQAIANWRPNVSVTANYGHQHLNNSLRRPVDLDHQRAGTLTVTQPLYRGGRTVAATRQSEAEVRAERANLLDREQVVLLSTIAAYNDLIRDRAIVELRSNAVRVLEQQRQATDARFRVGELTRTDVAQAEARLARAVSDLKAAEAQAQSSRAAYRRAVGQEPPQRLGDPPFLGELPRMEDDAVARAQDRAPRSLAAQQRIAAAQAGVDNAFGELLPQLNLVGTVSKSFNQTVRDDYVYQYALRAQLTVPIYQNGSEYSRVRAAKQNVGQRQADLDSARRQSAEGAIRAFRALEASKARVVSLSAQVRANGIALDGVRQEQQVGSRTILDVLNAEQEFLDSQVQLVSARRDVVVGHYTLLSETGQLTARMLKLPVEYYDEEKYYNDVREKWIGLGD